MGNTVNFSTSNSTGVQPGWRAHWSPASPGGRALFAVHSKRRGEHDRACSQVAVLGLVGSGWPAAGHGAHAYHGGMTTPAPPPHPHPHPPTHPQGNRQGPPCSRPPVKRRQQVPGPVRPARPDRWLAAAWDSGNTCTGGGQEEAAAWQAAIEAALAAMLLLCT